MDDNVTTPTTAELKGVALMKAFGLQPPEHLNRDERRRVDLHVLLDRLSIAIVQLGVAADQNEDEALAGRVDEYQKTHRKLSEAYNRIEPKDKPEQVDELALKARETLDRVDAEGYEGVRKRGLRFALQTLQEHQGEATRKKYTKFAKEAEKIEGEKDPVKRVELYFKLETDVIEADLAGREEDEPGSTWQARVDMSLLDANPSNKKAKKLKVDKLDREQAELGLHNACEKKIEDAMFSVPQRFQHEFREHAEVALRQMLDQLFQGGEAPDNRQALGKLVVEANTRMLQILVGLKRDYPPEAPPQARVHKGKLVLTKAAPKVQSLVLQGGGGKGTGYPPLLEEMNKAGTLRHIDLLVGTSIGALNATCLACGGLNDERQILDLKVFDQAYDPRHKKKERYPGIGFKEGIWPSCAGQMAKMDELTAASTADNLKGFDQDQLAMALSNRLAELDDETLRHLGLANTDPATVETEINKLAKKVKNQDFNASDRTSQMITFKDLAILHQLDPANFKELTITGWEGVGKEGHVVYFNAQNFPDMPVALAARVSMGLPIISPLFWNGRGPFYDGGLGSNAPMEAAPGLDRFYEGKDPADAEEELKGDDIPIDVQKAMAQTMLMTFDDGGKGSNNLYGDGRETTQAGGGEKVTVMGKGGVFDPANPEYDEILRKDANKVYNSGANTLQVYHAEEDTLSLGPLRGSPEEVEYAENMSRMKGLEQLDQRVDQAVEMNCGTVADALEAMTPAEIRRMLADGPPPQDADAMLHELHAACDAYVDVASALDMVTDDPMTALELMRDTVLCADCGPAVGEIMQACHDMEALDVPDLALHRRLIELATHGIAGLPSFLQKMVRKAVLLPMQKALREAQREQQELDDEEGGGDDQIGEDVLRFDWAQDFTARSFIDGVRKNRLIVGNDADKAHDALKQLAKAMQKVEREKQSDKLVEAARKAMDKLDDLLLHLRNMAGIDAYATSPSMLQMIAWFRERAEAQRLQLQEIVQGGTSSFPARNFLPWDAKDWKRQKKLAIKCGALEDSGASGLSDAMTDAVKAGKAAAKAKPSKQVLARRAAWVAWDRVHRVALQIRAQTRNANLIGYLQQCLDRSLEARDGHTEVN